MEAFISGRPAALHDVTLERRWGEITLTFVEVQIRPALSVPIELGGGPIGTLDVYGSDQLQTALDSRTVIGRAREP